jgi:RepB DNA-primase C-terminal helical domain
MSAMIPPAAVTIDNDSAKEHLIEDQSPSSESACSRASLSSRRSSADWMYALLSAGRGFSAEEIAVRLMTASEKAKQEGKRYAERTARRAKV